MAGKVKVTVNNLDPNNNICPECGKAYTPVKYYVGKQVSVNSARENLSTVQIEKKYSYLDCHTGGICLSCAGRQDKKKVLPMIIIMVIGVILCVLGLIMEIGRIKGTGTSNGIALIALGGIMFLCGLISVIINSSGKNVKNATMNSLSLFNYYIDHLKKDRNMNYSLDYIYPDEVEKR